MSRMSTRVARPSGASIVAVALAVACVAATGMPREPRRARRIAPEARRIDLSRAPLEELCLLEGIGPALAARIVAHRAVHGPFRSVDELGEVAGIGEATIEALRDAARANTP
ncbi:MAG: ComEA family DNA-binding protein [Phycisphaerales bacterium]